MDCLERHLMSVNRESIHFGCHSEWYKRHPRIKIAYGRPKCNMIYDICNMIYQWIVLL